MLLNVDRRRIYILSGVGVFLIMMLGLYHAPAYVPAEVSRMKTSVSTWLKGTEPSLNDELYKDSPHFSPSTKHNTAEDEYSLPEFEEPDPYEINEPSEEDAFHILPIATDDQPDLLSPDEFADRISAPAASHTAAALPEANDFVGVLPPVNILTAIESALAATHAASHIVSTETAVAHVTGHPHLEEMSKPEEQEATTFVTHISSSAAFAVPTHAAIPTNVREAFDDEKWYLAEGGDKRT